LLKAGANVESPNGDGQTALMIVARTSNVAAAKLLLDRGANVNKVEQWRSQTALIWAAAESQPAMVKELIARGADVNARSMVNNWERQVTSEPRAIHRPAGGLTPLLYAAREGCIECVKHLVAGKADLNLPDPEGITPLIMAVTNGHFDTGAYLLSAGADPNKWDWWGRTPLYEAVDLNTLPHGGRPDLPSTDQTTSLKMIELLLDAGANPNTQLKLLPPYRSVGADRGADGMLTIGTTPLLRAAKGLDAPAIALLLKHGARHDIPNSRGVLPVVAAGGQGSRNGDHAWMVHHVRCSAAFYRFPRSADQGRRQHQYRRGKRTIRSARGNHVGMERRDSVPGGQRRGLERTRYRRAHPTRCGAGRWRRPWRPSNSD
jgi:ankyrin repeat protein